MNTILSFPKHLHHLTKVKSGYQVEGLKGSVYTVKHVTNEYLYLLENSAQYLSMNQFYNLLQSN